MQTRQRPTGGVRIKRVVVLGGAAVVILVVGTLVYLAGSMQFTLGFPTRTASESASPTSAVVREPEVISQRPRDYGHMQAPTPAPGAAHDVRTAGVVTTASSEPPGMPPPPEGLNPPVAPAETPPSGTPVPSRGRRTPQGGSTTAKRTAPPSVPLAAPKPWRMSESSDAVGKSPFDDDEAKDKAGERETKLLEDARWERAADITKVLYRNQAIPIMTLGAFNSDIPESDVTLLVTRNVYDRWMTKVLIPHNTRLIAKSTGAQLEPGQEGVPMTIEEGHYPDGTILDFKKAKLHDRSGVAGLRGEVDNHLLENLAYAGIAALLNIGVRGAAGSPSGYQENLPQQYAGQVGQSITNSATRIIEQRVPRHPTLRAKASTEGYVSLQVNIDLSTVPTTKLPTTKR